MVLSKVSALQGDRPGAVRRVEAALRAFARATVDVGSASALGRAWLAELKGHLLEARESLDEARFSCRGNAPAELAVTEAAAELETRAKSADAAETMWSAVLARAERLGSAAAGRAVTGLAASRLAQGRGLAAWEDLAVQAMRYPAFGGYSAEIRQVVNIAASAHVGRWDEVEHQLTVGLEAADRRSFGIPDAVWLLELAIVGCRDAELSRKLRLLQEDHRSKPMGIT